MSYPIKLVDTNIIIRFLTQDDKKLASQAEQIFINARPNSIEICDVILIETSYVLLSVYNLKKTRLIEMFSLIIDYPAFKLNQSLWQTTLQIYENKQISLVDAYLCAKKQSGNYQALLNFDQRLNRDCE